MNRSVRLLALAVLVVVAMFAPRAQAATNVSGGITSNTTWNLAGSPYVMTDDVVVQTGATLTIDAGVQVRATNAASGDVELIVRGGLIAAGTTPSPIVFQSDALTTPAAWEGIVFETTSTATLQNVQIKHADYGLEFQTPVSANYTINGVAISTYQTRGVIMNGGTLTLSDITIDGTGSLNARGMEVTSTTLTLNGSYLHHAGVGLHATNANLTLNTSIFASNTSNGIHSIVSNGSRSITMDNCTLYGNVYAIYTQPNSSSYTVSMTVTDSIFGANTVVIGNSTYPVYLSTFARNIWWGTTQFSGVTVGTETGTIRNNALLVDPDNGNFAPTDRSPARSLAPGDPTQTIGAVQYAGASTGSGAHGYWYTNRTFAADSVTTVTGDVVVTPGVTLNFQPGATLKMATSDVMAGGLDPNKIEIRVEGTLEADGTLSKPVRLTSAAAVPAMGDWYGVVIFGYTEAFNVSQVDLGYAYRGVSLYSNDHIVAGSTIHHCSDAGIWIDAGTPSVEQTVVHSSNTGIYVQGGASVDLDIVDIYGNSSNGLYALSSTVNYSDGLIHDNSIGIYCYASSNSSCNMTLDHLTVAHNTSDGIYGYRVSSSSSWVTITLTNSSVTHNTQYGVRSGNVSYPVTFSCNGSNVWGNAANYGSVTPGSACVSWNPLYADAVGRDYEPTRFSPNRALGVAGTYVGALPYTSAIGPHIMGFLWDNYTFTAAGSPYPLLGDLYVPSGKTATIEPGAVFEVVPNADGMGGGLTTSQAEFRVLAGGTATLQGTGAPSVFRPDSDTPSAGMWYGLRFDDTPTSRVDNVRVEYPSYGIYLVGPQVPPVEDVELRFHSQAGIYVESVSGAQDVDILGARIIGTGSGTGIRLFNSNGDVRSSYVTHHQVGLHTTRDIDGNHTLYVVNNTFVHHQYGIQYNRTSSSSRLQTVHLTNNVIANSSYALFDSNNSGYSTTDNVTYNNFYNADYSSATFNVNTNNITSNPLVEDDDWDTFPRWWDGKLWAQSLSRDSGVTANGTNHVPSRDLAGNARPLGGAVDRGAYEFDTSANQEPRADAAGGSMQVARGESFSLNGSAATDPDGTIASAYWTTSNAVVLPGLSVTHTFNVDGAAWAYLTIVDDDGAEDHTLVSINVNIRPEADAGPAVFQDEGAEEDVFFDGTLSSDADGSIVSWSWDFGDGTPVSTASSPRHSYLSAGLYTVTLTVTDNEGLTDTDTTLATVFGTIDTVGPLIQHTEIANGKPVGQPVIVSADIQDPAGVTNAVLYYRPIGGVSASFAVMSNTGNNIWQATIPGGSVTAAGVEYWITAIDAATPDSNNSVAPAGAPGSDVFDFLVVGDPNPPNIAHTEISDGQPVGQAVTISATITDTTGVASASLYFRPAGGTSFGATNMVHAGSNVWTAQIPGFAAVEPGVQYYIEATDTSPIPNTGKLPSGAPGTLLDFTVGEGDTDGPLIAHTPVNNGQTAGQAVTVSAGIVDTSGVSSAAIHYRVAGSGGGFATAAMSLISGSNYAGTIPAGSVTAAGVEYYVRAVDTGANAATEPQGAPSVFHTFTAETQDTTAPAVTHTPIGNGQTEGVGVDIVATVTDTSSISTVRLHYRPVGFPFYQEVTMTTSGGGLYTGTIPSFSVTSAGVEYYLRAVDSHSNTGYHPSGAPGTVHTFTVGATADTTPPTITHTPVDDGQAEGDAVVVNAVITDASDIGSATLYYRATGAGSFSSFTMANSSGDNFTATIPGASVTPAGVDYYISAEDDSTASNSATSPANAPTSRHQFTVTATDTAGPSITDTPLTELPFGDDFVVSAQVTDPAGVDSVTLYWALDEQSFATVAMSLVTADTYRATIDASSIPDGTENLRYYVRATDTLDNASTSPALGASAPSSVELIYPDETDPTVSVTTITGPLTAGEDLVVTVTATDAESGISEVTIYYRTTGDVAFTALPAIGTGPYGGTIPGSVVEEPSIEVYAEASDEALNVGTSSTQTVTVEGAPDATPPSVDTSVVPNGQLAGQAVLVSATVLDDSGVDGATLHYRAQGDGSYTTLAMTLGGSGTWSASIPGGAVAEPAIDFYVSAVDDSTAANTGYGPAGAPDSPATFTVTSTDTAGPTLTPLDPGDSFTSGAQAEIQVDAVDPSGVANVSLFWRIEGSGSFAEVAMTGTGDTYLAIVGPVSAPAVEYYFAASDNLDNDSLAPANAPAAFRSVPVIVPDTTAPAIVHTEIADGQPTGVAVSVNATITDATGIDSATVYYRLSGSVSFSTVAMSNVGGSSWSALIAGSSIVDPGIEYYIQATDTATSPNTARLPSGAPGTLLSFMVLPEPEEDDETPPQVFHTPVAGNQIAGTALTVTAFIADDVAIESATLYFRPVGESVWLSVAMTETGNDAFAGTIPAFVVTTAGVQYYVLASDSASPANLTYSPAGAPGTYNSFTVVAADVAGPTVGTTDIEAEQTPGEAITLSATVSDASGVDSVTLYYRREGETDWESVTATNVGGNTFEAEIPARDVSSGTIEYYWSAEDTLGTVTTEPDDGESSPLTLVVAEEEGNGAGGSGGEGGQGGGDSEGGEGGTEAGGVAGSDAGGADSAGAGGGDPLGSNDAGMEPMMGEGGAGGDPNVPQAGAAGAVGAVGSGGAPVGAAGAAGAAGMGELPPVTPPGGCVTSTTSTTAPRWFGASVLVIAAALVRRRRQVRAAPKGS